MKLLKLILGFLIKRIYRIRVIGLENYHQAGDRVLIVSNHVSYLDPVLLAVALPEKLTFAINTFVAKGWLLRKLASVVTLFPMDPTNPLSSKSLIRYLQEDRKAVIFPEGRITVTGSLMKIYDGTGFVADKADAMVLPIRIDGAQYTFFSRMRGLLKLRWFPKITVTILPPRKIKPADSITGRQRRTDAGKALEEIMSEMMFQSSNLDRTLYQAFLDARSINGGKHKIVEDVQRKPLNYNKLMLASMVLGKKLAADTQQKEITGLLLPNMNSTLVAFLALQLYGRVPAMLNYSTGVAGMVSACRTAEIKVVVSSRRFVKLAKLEDAVAELEKQVRIVYLEDLATTISLRDKIGAWLAGRFPTMTYRRLSGHADANSPAVVLFTSGSEGEPKGVVLSHRNLLANREQLAARVDFSAQDIVLNVLPMFHSFGLTAGTLLPLFSGIRMFLYPSPLHYRIVPELAYEINATILFGTNTFLAGYARYAHPYDFYSIRYVFAGAEKLQEENRRVWSEKFGVRIFEGYGATETSPVLAANTPMASRAGSVGRFLPGIEYRLEPVPGIEEGGQLMVRGPNVMLGYLLPADPGKLVPPATEQGPGWYDTGDVVSVDDEGFIEIRGRVKRFAKIGGEMVSLALVEEMANRTWSDVVNAAVSLPDPQKGEMVVLATEAKNAERAAIQATARSQGLGEINVPKKVLIVDKVPLLGSGKTDYNSLKQMVQEQLERPVAEAVTAEP